MDRVRGFEPPFSFRYALLVRSQRHYTRIKAFTLEQIAGFEPALLVWKTNVLTVEHYICVLSV